MLITADFEERKKLFQRLKDFKPLDNAVNQLTSIWFIVLAFISVVKRYEQRESALLKEKRKLEIRERRILQFMRMKVSYECNCLLSFSLITNKTIDL